MPPRNFDSEFAALLEQDQDAGLVRFERSMSGIKQALKDHYFGTDGRPDEQGAALMRKLDAEWPFEDVEAIVSGIVWLHEEQAATTAPSYFGEPIEISESGLPCYGVEGIPFASKGFDYEFVWDENERVKDVEMVYVFTHSLPTADGKEEVLWFVAYQGELSSQEYAEVSPVEAGQRLAEQWPAEFALLNEALIVAPRGLLGQRLTTFMELCEEVLQNDAFSMYLEAYLSEQLAIKSPFLVGMENEMTLATAEGADKPGAVERHTIQLDGVLTEPLHGVSARIPTTREGNKALYISGVRLGDTEDSKEYVEIHSKDVPLLMSLRGAESLGSRALRGMYDHAGGDDTVLQQASELLDTSEQAKLLTELDHSEPEHIQKVRMLNEVLLELKNKAQRTNGLRFVDEDSAKECALKVTEAIQEIANKCGVNLGQYQIEVEGPGVLVPEYAVSNNLDESFRQIIVSSDEQHWLRRLQAGETRPGRITRVMVGPKEIEKEDGKVFGVEVCLVVSCQRELLNPNGDNSLEIAITDQVRVTLGDDSEITVPAWERYRKADEAIRSAEATYENSGLVRALEALHQEVIYADPVEMQSTENAKAFEVISEAYETTVPRDGSRKLLEALSQILADGSYIQLSDACGLVDGVISPLPDAEVLVGAYAPIADIRNDVTEDGGLVIVARAKTNGGDMAVYVPFTPSVQVHF